MNSIESELDALLGPRQAKQVPSLQKLRTTHHELARLLALGHKDVDISRATGYTTVRIQMLKKDPLFQELLQHYMLIRDAGVADMGARLRAMSMTAVEVITERLEESPDGLTMTELVKAAGLGLDRTGFGPSSTVNNNTTVSVQTLEQIKASIEKGHRGRVLSRNSEAPLGGDPGGSAGHNPEGEEGSRGESQGPAL